MNPTHHLNRSQHYLNYASADLAAGDCTRAARALYRAATHAVTATAVHWHHPHYSKGRLGLVVTGLVRDGRLRCAHWRTFREIRDLPGRIAAAPNAARPVLRRVRRRVDRLLAAVSAAIAGCPRPPTLAEIIAQFAAESVPQPSPPWPQTAGKLNPVPGQYVDPGYAGHPPDGNGSVAIQVVVPKLQRCHRRGVN